MTSVAIKTEDTTAYEEFVEVWRQELEQNWQGGYTQMPDEIASDPTLSPRAKHLYRALLSFMWLKTDKCWPSQKTLAEATGYSRSTVIRALHDLYERGYIEIWRRGLNQTNYYFINPLSFVKSFKPVGRGRGVLLQANGEEHRTTVETVPMQDVFIGLSGMCQPETSGSSNLEQQEVSNWNTNHTNQKNINGNSRDSNPSTPSGKGVGEKAIGNEQQASVLPTRTEDTNQSPTLINGSKPNQIENNQENMPRPAAAKAALLSKMGKSNTTAKAIAATTGIPAEHLAELGVEPERRRRPIPDFIERFMADISRELGDNPRSAKSSVTRATKLFYFGCQYIGNAVVGNTCLGNFQEDPEDVFARLLYTAKAGALKVNNIRHHTGPKPNRMPAFFACLENLFGLSPEEREYVRSDEPLYVG